MSSWRSASVAATACAASRADPPRAAPPQAAGPARAPALRRGVRCWERTAATDVAAAGGDNRRACGPSEVPFTDNHGIAGLQAAFLRADNSHHLTVDLPLDVETTHVRAI